MTNFQPFTTTHGAVVVVFLAITTIIVLLGWRWRDTTRQTRLEMTLGLGSLALWLWINGRLMTPANFDPAKSLPLHLCDLSALIAPLALLTRRRFLRALLYFWGLGLNTQAFITPLVRSGPAQIEFWWFWMNHSIIVGAAIYDLIVRRFRPTWRDYFFAVAASGLYLAIIFPIDVIFGFNYGYVGKIQPDKPTIIKLLGPWPGRVAVISVLACGAMALLMLPWQIARALVRGESVHTEPDRSP